MNDLTKANARAEVGDCWAMSGNGDSAYLKINPFDSPGFAVLIRKANEGGLKPGVY